VLERIELVSCFEAQEATSVLRTIARELLQVRRDTPSLSEDLAARHSLTGWHHVLL
jgi:hypothetical protein